MNSNIKIFLSYSDYDKKMASELKNKLSNYGLFVFFASEDIEGGYDFESKLYEEIEDCKIFIMLLTKNYHPSKFTDQETGIAFSFQKRILPISIDGTLPYGFVSRKQAIECPFPFEESKIKEIADLSKIVHISTSSDLDKLLSKLEHSKSYKESAKLAIELKEYDNFSESQLSYIAFSILNNPQVLYSYIAYAVINEIIRDSLDKVNPILAEQLAKFHDPSHPSLEEL